MKAFNNYFYVVIVCALGIIFQSCWKDKTIKDNGFNPYLDVTPSLGIPLADVKIKGEDIVYKMNKDSLTNAYVVRYDVVQDSLCVLVYDKMKETVKLPTSPPYDADLNFPLNYLSDIRKWDWDPLEAYVDIYVNNSYGADIDFRVEELKYKRADGVIDNIASPGYLLNPNTIRANHVGSFLGDGNVLIDSIKVNEPKKIIFEGTDAKVKFHADYIVSPTWNGEATVIPIIRVPAHLTMNTVRMDTSNANFGSIANMLDNEKATVEGLTVYLKIENFLPMNAAVKIYFADENHRILDSLTKDDIIIQPGTQRGGTDEVKRFRLKNSVVSEKVISMTKEQVKKIKDTKYLLIREHFTSRETTNGPITEVKLFKENYMRVIVSAKVDMKLDGTLDDISTEIQNATDTTKNKK